MITKHFQLFAEKTILMFMYLLLFSSVYGYGGNSYAVIFGADMSEKRYFFFSFFFLSTACWVYVIHQNHKFTCYVFALRFAIPASTYAYILAIYIHIVPNSHKSFFMHGCWQRTL